MIPFVAAHSTKKNSISVLGGFHGFLGKGIPTGIIGCSTGYLLRKGKVQMIDGRNLFEDFYSGVRNFAANAVTRDNNNLFFH